MMLKKPEKFEKLSNTVPFPLGIDARWVTPESARIPDPCLKNWLLDTSSLTERLQSQCRKFSLRLLGQRPMFPELEELNSLGQSEALCSDSDWQIREVVLTGEGQPWVFARSVLPSALCQEDFAGLGEQPLGQIIFNDARFKRSPFEICQLDSHHPTLAALDISSSHQLWGRRSAFTFHQFRMLVAEVFLPAAPAYKQLPVEYG